MANITVSVLIPVYNVEKYLKRCLDSICKQSLTNIEIIAVNDGSTDNSLQILQEYQIKDARIKIINKENGGLPSARNAGISAATGKYLAFVDSDDYIQPDMLKKLVDAAKKDNSEIVICGANILPDEPRANQWLYDCLSPKAGYYKKFEPELLFARGDTTPFLWRCLVKRSLITENDFKLDEDIILGEDKAFQCKLYPKAKGITVIEDKLYNYYWCRPDSLMSKQAYENKEKRVIKHAKLIERIGKYLVSEKDENEKDENEKDENKKQELREERDEVTNQKDDIKKQFLDWSIPFIYNDFLYISLENKLKTAPDIMNTWKSCGYYRYCDEIEGWKQEAFEYIKEFVHGKYQSVVLSIVIPMEYESRYLNEMLENLMRFNKPDIEIILVNNGIDSNQYSEILKCIKKQKNIRLFNTEKHSTYAECLNDGVKLASGTYLCFLETQDWLADSENIYSWINDAVEKKADISICKYIQKKVYADVGVKKNLSIENKKELYDLDFHSALYKRTFLVKNKLEFINYSILTGLSFVCRALSCTKNITEFGNEAYFIREMHRPDWISTEKCVQVLECLDELLALSLEKKDYILHGTVFSVLNGDKLKQMIVNNTKPYSMPVAQAPNGENSQIEVIETLFSIMEKMDLEMLKKYGFNKNRGILDTLYEVIQERHKYLAEIAN